jgi:hypothetical protein
LKITFQVNLSQEIISHLVKMGFSTIQEKYLKKKSKIVEKKCFFCHFRVDYLIGDFYSIVCLEKERARGKTAVSDQSMPGNRCLFFEVRLGVLNKMKKVIVLSTVLGLSALGMACGEAANNAPANNANKANAVTVSTPAASTPAPVNTAPPANAAPANAANNTMKPANTNAAANTMKPANTATPAPAPTKKP